MSLRARPLLFALALLLMMLSVVGCDDESGPSGPVHTGVRPLLAVVLDGGLVLLDRETGDWLGEPFGLGTAPNDIVAEGEALYVINSISNDLHEFRYQDGAVGYTRHLDIGLTRNRNPYCVAATGEGRLLVSNLLENSVSVIDLAEWRVDTLWQTGPAPEGIVVAGGYAYVVNSGYSFASFTFSQGSLYVYDLSDGSLVDSLILGVNAQYAALGVDGTLAVTCTGDYQTVGGEIHLVSLDPLATIDILPVDGFPGRIASLPEGGFVIAAGGWASDGASNGLVLRLGDGSSALAVEQIATALGSIAIAGLADGGFYVAARDAERLELYNSDSRIATYALPDLPVALTLWDPAQP